MLKLVKRGSEWFVSYDVGPLAVELREDKVSDAEALELMQGEDRALLALQRRLEAAGIDPYASNISET